MAGRRKVEVYRDRKSKWRWRLLAANGSDILGDSGQGYIRKGYCLRRAGELNPGVKVEVLD
jgi:uncharacterized protein YegP (UPF0339 family)